MYQFREVVLRNKTIEKKVLVIEFDEADKAIVAEFLMTDASMLKYSVLKTINHVLSGVSEYEKTSGNRYGLVIKRDKTQIEDLFEGLFDDFDTYPSYRVDTAELRDLIIMWRDKLNVFEQDHIKKLD